MKTYKILKQRAPSLFFIPLFLFFLGYMGCSGIHTLERENIPVLPYQEIEAGNLDMEGYFTAMMEHDQPFIIQFAEGTKIPLDITLDLEGQPPYLRNGG